MDTVFILVFGGLSYFYAFLIGTILNRLYNNPHDWTFIRGNAFLSLAITAVIVVLFRLIGWTEVGLFSTLFVLIGASMVYGNVFVPIIIRAPKEEQTKKAQIIQQMWISMAFIPFLAFLELLYGL